MFLCRPPAAVVVPKVPRFAWLRTSSVRAVRAVSVARAPLHAKGVRCKLYAVRHGRAHARAEQLGVAALVVRVEELGVRTDGPAHDDQDRRVPDSLRAVRNLCIRKDRAVRAAVSVAGLCMAHLHLRRHAVAHGERPERHASGSVRRCAAT